MTGTIERAPSAGVRAVVCVRGERTRRDDDGNERRD